MNYEQELKDALLEMLDQYGANYTMSCVENACALLNHPQTNFPEYENGISWDNDCCYCRSVVYSKQEKKRRKKEKIPFVDRT